MSNGSTTASVTIDVLRRAAAKIRETAQDATSGPWEQDGSSVAAGEFIILDALPDDGSGTWTKQEADAAHVALWSPDVAELVAAWLDREAWAVGQLHDIVELEHLKASLDGVAARATLPEHDEIAIGSSDSPAMDLARRILGKQP